MDVRDKEIPANGYAVLFLRRPSTRPLVHLQELTSGRNGIVDAVIPRRDSLCSSGNLWILLSTIARVIASIGTRYAVWSQRCAAALAYASNRVNTFLPYACNRTVFAMKTQQVENQFWIMESLMHFRGNVPWIRLQRSYSFHFFFI